MPMQKKISPAANNKNHYCACCARQVLLVADQLWLLISALPSACERRSGRAEGRTQEIIDLIFAANMRGSCIRDNVRVIRLRVCIQLYNRCTVIFFVVNIEEVM